MTKTKRQDTTQQTTPTPKAPRRRKTAALAPEATETQPTPETPKAPKPTSKAPYAVRRNGLLSAFGLPCLCGCGAPTHTEEARFLSGHDAKLRKAVLLLGAPLPDVVRPFFEHGETVAGLALVDGVVVDVKATAEETAEV